MRFVIFFVVLSLPSFCFSQERGGRDFLQKKIASVDLDKVLQSPNQWIAYPAYEDRASWDKLPSSLRMSVINEGINYLDYKWRVIKATDYLAFERTGNRDSMQNPYNANNNALMNLIMAELMEGKGRFMDQIINGVWYTCDMQSWSSPAHLIKQKSKRTLPEFDEHIVDIGSTDIGSLLAWSRYFFRKAWDSINPIVAKRVEKLVKERVIQPYYDHDDYWWQALNKPKGYFVNNWNPWCNFNILTCILLLETDEKRKTYGVKKTMTSVDQFINYVKSDGACEEGPTYWSYAPGKLYDYLEVLYRATGGNVDIFDQELIKRMGEYISNTYVGDDWQVNFADAYAREKRSDIGLIYRYGKAVSSKEMQGFAGYLFSKLSNT